MPWRVRWCLRGSMRSGVSGHRKPAGPAMRTVAFVLFWIAALVVTVATSAHSAAGVALAAAVASLGFLAHDVSNAKRAGVTPIAAFALVSAATGLANMTGFLSQFTADRHTYFLYADEDYLYLASLLALAGTVLTIVGFRLVVDSPRARALCALLPPVRGELSTKRLIRSGIVAAAFGIVAHLMVPLRAYGTFGGIIFLLPQLASFVLARIGAERRIPAALKTALAIAVVESVRALFFAYLRADIAAPMIAPVLGAVLGARSLAPLRSKIFVPVYVFGLIFVVYFGAFGSIRAKAGSGVGRIQEVMVAADNAAPASGNQQSVWSRLTNFNQLSQVGRVVEEDGFLKGSTLEYLGYVFIPRFLWPDKPIVAKGGWFAWRIGQSWVTRDGRYTNSINMTIPGELYLNFGWAGVLIGCIAFGVLVGVFWTRSGFWNGASNVLGSAFGYYLFWVGLILGADLQIIVTLLAVYLIFMAASMMLRHAAAGSRRAALAVPPRSTAGAAS